MTNLLLKWLQALFSTSKNRDETSTGSQSGQQDPNSGAGRLETDNETMNTSREARARSTLDNAKTQFLMTPNLSKLMQESVHSSRCYAREERYLMKQTTLIKAFEREFKRKIRTLEDKINAAEGGENTEQELEVFRRMQNNIAEKRAQLELNLEFQKDLNRRAGENLAKALDEVFVSAAMMEADHEEDLPVKEFDIREQSQKTVRKLGHPEEQIRGGYTPEPSDVGTPGENRHEPSAEDESRVLAQDALAQALYDLSIAQHHFDTKEEARDQDWSNTIAADMSGEPVVYSSQEDFDAHWVQNFREITRNLIEAEEPVTWAKTAAQAAGVDQDVVDQMLFPDDAGDPNEVGYPLSQEDDTEEAHQSVAPFVSRWLELGVSGTADAVAFGVTVDTWDFKEVDMSDSISCIDVDMHREKLC